MTLAELQACFAVLAREAREPHAPHAQAFAALAGEVLARDMASDFDGSHSPDGGVWAPVKRGGKPLIVTGALRQRAIDMARAAHAEASEDGLTVSYDTARLPIYGPYLDRGTRTIPARPFVGASAAAANELAGIAADLAAEALAARMMERV